MSIGHHRPAAVLLAVTLLAGALAAVRHLDPLPEGLRASYFSAADWTSSPLRSTTDHPSSASIVAAWDDEPPQSVSATWSGFFIVLVDGTYSFATDSEDGSWVSVDGRLVVDNGGRHGRRRAAGSIDLDRGVHTIFIRYFRSGGAPLLDLLWSRGGGPLTRVPAGAFTSKQVTFGRFLLSTVLKRSVAPAAWLWLAILVAVVSATAPAGRAERVLMSGAIEAALLLVSLLLLVWFSPFRIEGDGATRFDALSRLLTTGEISTMPYSMIGPLASAPLWWAGRLAAATEAWCARFNFVVFVIGLAVWYRALTPEIDRRTVLTFLLLVAVASMFPHHDSRYYGEVFTAVLVGVGLSLVVLKDVWWGWVLAVVGTANTPAALPGLALAAGWLAFRRRKLSYLVPIALAAAAILLESWLRRGSPFLSGYEGNRGAQTVLPFSGQPGFSYPFVFGLLSILFSFGKGVFLFAPGLLLLKPRSEPSTEAERDLLVVWLLFLSGLVLVYSKWWAWYGGVFWGPRYFLFASIPASYLLAKWLLGPRASPAGELLGIGCAIWSTWVGANGLLYGFDRMEICEANHYALEFLCWYTPEYSPLFRPFIASRPLAPHELVLLAFFGCVGISLVTRRLVRLRRVRDRAMRTPS